MDVLNNLNTDLLQRQDSRVIGGLLGDIGSNVEVEPTLSSTSFERGVVFTGIINGPPTIIPLPPGISTTSTSTPSSSSSTGSTSSTPDIVSTISTSPTTIAALTTSPSTPSTIPTSASTPVVIPTPTTTPTTTPTAPVIITSSDGTSIVYVTSLAHSTSSATPAPPTSFLQNKPLEAGVFSIVGIVIFVIIFVIVTFTLRRRRRDRLENDIADAVTFDPGMAARYIDEENRINAVEKYSLSGGSSGHGHSAGHITQLAYAPPPQYGYYGQGYEQQVAYRASLPQVPVHNQNNPITTGGANLTRKYSNRKPVPPLLPNPVYDPSRSPVLPEHFYGQENAPPLVLHPSSPSAPTPDQSTLAQPNHFEEDPYTGMLKVVNH